ncbi:MAG: hypothetical protein H6686_01410 [Fibrobacteria bacterium]|nr:hypothetical protein [Fibrobacteria bacterium]
MRYKLLALAASSLLVMACNDSSSSSTAPTNTSTVSDQEVLTQVASGAGEMAGVGGAMATSTEKMAGELRRAARAVDACSDHSSHMETDSATGGTTSYTITMSDGSPLTCTNLTATSTLKVVIKVVEPTGTMDMVMMVGLKATGGMMLSGTGSGSFSEEGHTFGFKDLAFQGSANAAGEVTMSGTMAMTIDGATTSAIEFDESGLTYPQTVTVTRNGKVIGSIQFVSDEEVVVKDATGKVIPVT